VRLLFDQNLSPGLSRSVADVYPGSVHVREVGLRDSGDSEIWDYAKLNGFIIVSEDSAFQQRSLLYWLPTKIHLAAGWELPDKAY
jgi:predicted nuclease of predicted toxin-antitoxin system